MYMNKYRVPGCVFYPTGSYGLVDAWQPGIFGWDAWTRSDQQMVWKMYGTFMIVVQKGSMYGISMYIYCTLHLPYKSNQM